jgi:hypothetical protein
MRVVLSTALLWLLATPAMPAIQSTCQANCWRGLTPLRSTCDDVKEVLSIEKCTMPLTNYKRPEMDVVISFAIKDCDEAPQGWRVAEGTVTSIILSPRVPMTPDMFGLDISKYQKRDDGEIVGLAHYTSEEEGVTVDVYSGVIQNLFLSPRKRDNVMRCKPRSAA